MTILHIVIFVAFLTSLLCSIAFNVAWYLCDFMGSGGKGVKND